MSYFGIKKDDTLTVPSAITIDLFHYVVHAGLGFTIDTYGDINSSNINITFKTPPATTEIHMMYKVDSAASADFHIYEGCTVDSAGTDATPINRRRIGTPATSTMLGYGTGSLVAGKVQVGGAITVGSAVTLRHDHYGAGKKVGGSSDATWEFILKSDTVYGIVLTDTSSSANVANLILSWFEVTPS